MPLLGIAAATMFCQCFIYELERVDKSLLATSAKYNFEIRCWSAVIIKG